MAEDRKSDRAISARATAGFLIPMLLHMAVGLPASVAVAAIAAHNLAMMDVRGDYRLRVMLLVGMAALLASAGALGVLAATSVVAAVAATAFVAAAAAIWRHVGSDYGLSLSTSSMLLFLVSLDHTARGVAVSSPVWGILAGAGVGLLLQTAMWPLRAQHPLRRAVSDSWIALSGVCDALQAGRPAGSLDTAEGVLRTTLDKTAKQLSGAVRHRRNGLAERLETLSVRAARLGVRVVAVHTALDGLGEGALRQRVEPSLAAVRTSLTNSARSIAVAVVSQQPAHLATCEVRLRRLNGLLESVRARLLAHPEDAGAEMLAELVERVREALPEVLEALRATMPRAGERALFAAELFDVQTWQLKPLATALNLRRNIDPALVRFGARLAVMAGFGAWLYRGLGVPHGYWIPFTLVVVMQPDYGSTRRRAWQRVAGTLAGSLAASLLMMMEPGSAMRLVWIAIGVFAFSFNLKRNVSLAGFGAAFFVVILLQHSGEGGATLALERVGATLVGGVLSFVGAMIFWPVWEHDRFGAVLKNSLQATADYLRRLEFKLREGGALDDETVLAKRRAEAASAAVFSSVGRLFADAHNPREQIERAATLANGNQRVLRLANLIMVGLHEGPGRLSADEARYFAVMTEALAHLAAQADITAASACDPGLESCTAALDTLPSLDTTQHAAAMHLARIATEVRAMLAGS